MHKYFHSIGKVQMPCSSLERAKGSSGMKLKGQVLTGNAGNFALTGQVLRDNPAFKRFQF